MAAPVWVAPRRYLTFTSTHGATDGELSLLPSPQSLQRKRYKLTRNSMLVRYLATPRTDNLTPPPDGGSTPPMTLFLSRPVRQGRSTPKDEGKSKWAIIQWRGRRAAVSHFRCNAGGRTCMRSTYRLTSTEGGACKCEWQPGMQGRGPVGGGRPAFVRGSSGRPRFRINGNDWRHAVFRARAQSSDKWMDGWSDKDRGTAEKQENFPCSSKGPMLEAVEPQISVGDEATEPAPEPPKETRVVSRSGLRKG